MKSNTAQVPSITQKGGDMLIESNKEDLARITDKLYFSGTLSTAFEFGGFVYEIVRKDFYLEQHYKKIPYTEKKS